MFYVCVAYVSEYVVLFVCVRVCKHFNTFIFVGLECGVI